MLPPFRIAALLLCLQNTPTNAQVKQKTQPHANISFRQSVPRVPGGAILSKEIPEVQLLAERATGLGGSDASSYMNVGYGCRRKLFYGRTGTTPDYPDLVFGGNAHTDRGSTVEAKVREEYERRTGRLVEVPLEVVRSDASPHLIVHPDGIIREGFDTPSGDGVLEIKSHADWAWDQFQRDGLYIGYQFQLQHAMAVTGCKWGAFAIHHKQDDDEFANPSDYEIKYWDVQANPALQEKLVYAASETWIQIQTGTAPDRVPLKGDKRCTKCAWRDTCWQSEDKAEMLSQLKRHRQRATYHNNRAKELEIKLARFEPTDTKEENTVNGESLCSSETNASTASGGTGRAKRKRKVNDGASTGDVPSGASRDGGRRKRKGGSD